MVLMKPRAFPAHSPNPPIPSLHGPGHSVGKLGSGSMRKGSGIGTQQVRSIIGRAMLPQGGGEKCGWSRGCSGTRSRGSHSGSLWDAARGRAGRGGAETASTGLSCKQGFTQLSSFLSSPLSPSLSSHSLPALLGCTRGRDIGCISNPSPPRHWAVSRPQHLSSVQGEPLPVPRSAFPWSHNSLGTVWKGVKNTPPHFCSGRAPLPHPPMGPGSQSEKFGGSSPSPPHCCCVSGFSDEMGSRR